MIKTIDKKKKLVKSDDSKTTKASTSIKKKN